MNDILLFLFLLTVYFTFGFSAEVTCTRLAETEINTSEKRQYLPHFLLEYGFTVI